MTEHMLCSCGVIFGGHHQKVEETEDVKLVDLCTPTPERRWEFEDKRPPRRMMHELRCFFDQSYRLQLLRRGLKGELRRRDVGLKSLFDMFDEDGNGTIEKEELITAVAQVLGITIRLSDVDNMVASGDTIELNDFDVFVFANDTHESWRESVIRRDSSDDCNDHCLLRRDMLRYDSVIRNLFRGFWILCDADGSGYLDKAEYTRLHTNLYATLNVEATFVNGWRREARRNAEIDWENDTAGKKTLDRHRFFISLFQIVDTYLGGEPDRDKVAKFLCFLLDLTSVDTRPEDVFSETADVSPGRIAFRWDVSPEYWLDSIAETAKQITGDPSQALVLEDHIDGGAKKLLVLTPDFLEQRRRVATTFSAVPQIRPGHHIDVVLDKITTKTMLRRSSTSSRRGSSLTRRRSSIFAMRRLSTQRSLSSSNGDKPSNDHTPQRRSLSQLPDRRSSSLFKRRGSSSSTNEPRRQSQQQTGRRRSKKDPRTPDQEELEALGNVLSHVVDDTSSSSDDGEPAAVKTLQKHSWLKSVKAPSPPPLDSTVSTQQHLEQQPEQKQQQQQQQQQEQQEQQQEEQPRTRRIRGRRRRRQVQGANDDDDQKRSDVARSKEESEPLVMEAVPPPILVPTTTIGSVWSPPPTLSSRTTEVASVAHQQRPSTSPEPLVVYMPSTSTKVDEESEEEQPPKSPGVQTLELTGPELFEPEFRWEATYGGGTARRDAWGPSVSQPRSPHPRSVLQSQRRGVALASGCSLVTMRSETALPRPATHHDVRPRTVSSSPSGKRGSSRPQCDDDDIPPYIHIGERVANWQLRLPLSVLIADRSKLAVVNRQSREILPEETIGRSCGGSTRTTPELDPFSSEKKKRKPRHLIHLRCRPSSDVAAIRLVGTKSTIPEETQHNNIFND